MNEYDVVSGDLVIADTTDRCMCISRGKSEESWTKAISPDRAAFGCATWASILVLVDIVNATFRYLIHYVSGCQNEPQDILGLNIPSSNSLMYSKATISYALEDSSASEFRI
jgi:hypothetical protein